ncbi:putative DsbA family dithiol-disulfide isomerase [Labedella gwakjiensis]|uniref:DsbA family oxidoreductase n=1 Tax=Labedella gwakjiensis TaxID=390269 RepID=A0A2P8H066_9MICO|nr:DsbA family oxidoreductase [Labedella gwakjiensis]PSL39614.1 putative DsbA family dithiol-disulfide isomerase [Labedella gwakjiensis]RUQ85996.1 DsbA family oxidoreductase [Labedella gwakjiensis]
MNSDTLRVDVWSDIACPWCYIGKRRFEAGEAAWRESTSADAPAVELVFHSFELSPDTPEDFEGDEADYLARHKGIDAGQARQMLDHVTGIAATVGLEYRFDLLQHTNTVLAHELIHFAASQGRQLEMTERLMRAYFTEGRHLGRTDELVSLAAEIGLDADAAATALHEHTFRDDVMADERQASELGINGVPFFVIDGKWALSGAQEPATFAAALAHADRERTSVPVSGGAEA